MYVYVCIYTCFCKLLKEHNVPSGDLLESDVLMKDAAQGARASPVERSQRPAAAIGGSGVGPGEDRMRRADGDHSRARKEDIQGILVAGLAQREARVGQARSKARGRRTEDSAIRQELAQREVSQRRKGAGPRKADAERMQEGSQRDRV